MRHDVFRGLRWLATGGLLIACAGSVAPTVRPGIEVLLTDSLALVQGRRVALVTNLAAVDGQGVGDITRLRGAGVNLVALFAPEHGLTVQAAPGERVASTTDSATRIPIYSLYGRVTAPTDEMLAGVDVIVVDLPDVGARYFTYLATTIGVMRSAARMGIPVVVLDRPNPLGGVRQGNVLDTSAISMVGPLAIPMRHGLTAGEEARLAVADLHIPVRLTVVPVLGWRRSMSLDETGLPFRAPSPNLRDLEALYHYPGLCLFEGTALSVGRGTEFPFHQVGAPWLDTATVLRRIRAKRLPGVRFEGVTFTPHRPGDGKFADTAVVGIRLRLTDPGQYDPTRVAVELLSAIRAVHPDSIRIGGSFDRLAGGPALREALLAGTAPERILASWEAPRERFSEHVAPFLLY